jgi:hypothetical protein
MKGSKRADMPFIESNGKYEVEYYVAPVECTNALESIFDRCSVHFANHRFAVNPNQV